MPSFANSVAEYEVRRQAYLSSAASTNNISALVIQAYLGVPLNQDILERTLANIQIKKNRDFEINQLIRVLFLTKDSTCKILNTLKKQPFWLTKGELERQYWSENHMILWMSSAWLLHEKFGWELSDTMLHKRLLHFLTLKVEYGFYEFFSPVYFPYLLSGLLNLADFSEDEQIKTLATQAAVRLIKNCLLFVNDKGIFFPAAGRSQANKYINGYDHNHAHFIHLMTGLGRKQTRSSQIGSFIATTQLNMSDAIADFQTNVDQIISNGHALSKNVHQHLSRFDKTLFQWSSGAYFHPDVIEDTFWLIDKINLWDHEAFKPYLKGTYFSPYFAQLIAEQIPSVTQSSVISQSNVALYKNKGVVLSSIQNFWPGSQGYQQWPWVAAIDNLAVWTQSGKINADGKRQHKILVNTSLPYIKQKSNMLLIMYKANNDLNFVAHPDNSVTLHWPQNFDQSIEKGRWLIGRRKNSYIAVYKPCDGKINDIYACDNQDGQTWAAVVGNQSTYGSFNGFIHEIENTDVEEKWIWRWNWNKLNTDYYGKIRHLNQIIEKTWPS
ncbi:MAG: hypothetical protein K0U37_07205 [Gammaproteobacteria bacterium]|nr:hypothetical protein [Gammaproteobacteria bacterium]